MLSKKLSKFLQRTSNLSLNKILSTMTKFQVEIFNVVKFAADKYHN